MTRNLFFALLLIFALASVPALAKDDSASDDSTVPVLQPDSPAASAKADNSLGSLTESSSGPEAPASAPDMALTDNGPDPLANFGPSSGTVIGNRAVELRDEVLRLRASVNLNSSQFAILRSGGAAGAVQYHSTVAAITARLQSGTTRGNPILLRQWQEANSSLEEVTTSLGRLNSLQTSVDADASLAAYLLQSIQAAFQLSGGVDEDLDQLKLLRDEVSRQIVQLDYLRNQTVNDIERQTNYLTAERENLQTLAFSISRGELLGNSLANRPVIVNMPTAMNLPEITGSVAPAPMASPTTPVTPSVARGPQPMSPRELMEESGDIQPGMSSNAVAAGNEVPPTIGRLLVLIRYNQPVVDYEQQLSQAVGTAMERRPDAQFSVVAVSPSSGDPADLAHQQETAERDAEAVKRSLIQLGLSPSRIVMASTQTQNASTPEVHIYVR